MLDEQHREKRRRSNDVEHEERVGETGAEALPEVEQFRSAEDGEALQMEGIEMAAPEIELPEMKMPELQPAEDFTPAFDEQEEVIFPQEDEEGLPSARRTRLSDAMAADDFTHAEKTPASAAKGDVARARKGAKRRMVMDDQVLIRSEVFRHQSRDTSAIVRDVSSSKTAVPPPRADPFFGPPSLPFLPAVAAHMACFKPRAGEASPERARRAQHEDVQEPTMEDGLRAEEDEQWRFSEDQEELSGLPQPLVFEGSKPEEEAVHFATFDEVEMPQLDEMENEREQSDVIPSFDCKLHRPPFACFTVQLTVADWLRLS